MNDPRWADLTLPPQSRLEDAEIVLIGFPTDVGVARNGGRVGAAKGPAAIRNQLHKFTPHVLQAESHGSVIRKIFDYGDISTSTDVEKDQHQLAKLIDALLTTDKLPIIVGGGHETTYGHALGYMKSQMAFSILNIDAHTDVRPLVNGLAHSGSPFRQVLDAAYPTLVNYTVMGLQYHSVAFEHLSYIKGKSGQLVFKEELSPNWYQRCMEGIVGPTLLSIDLDVLDQSYAPGVSAPNPNGLPPHDLYQLAYYAGMNPHIRSVDIVELNPDLDLDNHTAKIAALILWWFSVGYINRKYKSTSRFM